MTWPPFMASPPISGSSRPASAHARRNGLLAPEATHPRCCSSSMAAAIVPARSRAIAAWAPEVSDGRPRSARWRSAAAGAAGVSLSRRRCGGCARRSRLACSGSGISAGNIAIGGDSAGGGLSLATMLRLRDGGRALPGCAWLASPWVDLAMTGASMESKAAIDPADPSRISGRAGRGLSGRHQRRRSAGLAAPCRFVRPAALPGHRRLGRNAARRCGAHRRPAGRGRCLDPAGDLAGDDPCMAALGGKAHSRAKSHRLRRRLPAPAAVRLTLEDFRASAKFLLVCAF